LKFRVLKLTFKIVQNTIHGQKVRFQYCGLKKLSNNCFEIGHYKNECENEKRQWLTFVANFMDHFPEIDKSMYGRWSRMLEDEMLKVRQGKDSIVVSKIIKQKNAEQTT